MLAPYECFHNYPALLSEQIYAMMKSADTQSYKNQNKIAVNICLLLVYLPTFLSTRLPECLSVNVARSVDQPTHSSSPSIHPSIHLCSDSPTHPLSKSIHPSTHLGTTTVRVTQPHGLYTNSLKSNMSAPGGAGTT